MKNFHGVRIVWVAVLGLALSHCGKGGGGGDNGDNANQFQSGDCTGGGWCGTSAITVTANLSDSKALFTLQGGDSSASGSLSTKDVSKAAKC